jgi:undecaprenyl-diphosphatase
MDAWDLDLIYFLNGFVGRWPRFDDLVVVMSDMHLIKGGIIAALFWWAWYSKVPQARAKALCGLIAGIVALGAARAMAHVLPFRIRPVADPALGLYRVPGLDYHQMERWWSAFPSDHAALFVALAAALWMISRPVGAFALAHTAVVILMPRVYLGLHRPSDLLAGAAVGVLASMAVATWPARHRVVETLLSWERRWPAFFYALFFVFIFELSELFTSLRYGLSLLRKLLDVSA